MVHSCCGGRRGARSAGKPRRPPPGRGPSRRQSPQCDSGLLCSCCCRGLPCPLQPHSPFIHCWTPTLTPPLRGRRLSNELPRATRTASATPSISVSVPAADMLGARGTAAGTSVPAPPRSALACADLHPRPHLLGPSPPPRPHLSSRSRCPRRPAPLFSTSPQPFTPFPKYTIPSLPQGLNY